MRNMKDGGGENMKHKHIWIDTLAGLKEAERLKARGWVIASSSLFSVQMVLNNMGKQS